MYRRLSKRGRSGDETETTKESSSLVFVRRSRSCNQRNTVCRRPDVGTGLVLWGVVPGSVRSPLALIERLITITPCPGWLRPRGAREAHVTPSLLVSGARLQQHWACFFWALLAAQEGKNRQVRRRFRAMRRASFRPLRRRMARRVGAPWSCRVVASTRWRAPTTRPTGEPASQ